MRELRGKVSYRPGALTTAADSVTPEVRLVTATSDSITSGDRNNYVVYTTTATAMVVTLPLVADGFRFTAINDSNGRVFFDATASGHIDGSPTATQFGLMELNGYNQLDIYQLATTWWTSERYFRSASKVVTSGATETLAHGLGGQPTRMSVIIEIGPTATGNYSPGDQIRYTQGQLFGGVARGLYAIADVTNLHTVFGSDGNAFTAPDLNSGAGVSFINTSLTAYFEAWY